MKKPKAIVFALLTILSLPALADEYVPGYVRWDGAYIEGGMVPSAPVSYEPEPYRNPYLGVSADTAAFGTQNIDFSSIGMGPVDNF